MNLKMWQFKLLLLAALCVAVYIGYTGYRLKHLEDQFEKIAPIGATP